MKLFMKFAKFQHQRVKFMLVRKDNDMVEDVCHMNVYFPKNEELIVNSFTQV